MRKPSYAERTRRVANGKMIPNNTHTRRPLEPAPICRLLHTGTSRYVAVETLRRSRVSWLSALDNFESAYQGVYASGRIFGAHAAYWCLLVSRRFKLSSPYESLSRVLYSSVVSEY